MSLISLSFIDPIPLYEKVKPYAIHVALPNVPASEQTNLVTVERHDIPLIDARTLEDDELTYESSGFQFKHLPALSTREFSTNAESLDQYCRKMLAFVKKEFDAEAVMCYDVRVRHGNTTSGEYAQSKDLERSYSAPPVFSVHIDHTQSSGVGRIRRHLTTEEASKYLNPEYRSRIINTWQPIRNPITSSPLTFCPISSTALTSLVAVDQVSPDYVFDLYQVAYSPGQKWYWLSGQTPEEVAVFVQFDSDAAEAKDGRVGGCPHAAFRIPSEIEGDTIQPRESVEARFIVFNRV